MNPLHNNLAQLPNNRNFKQHEKKHQANIIYDRNGTGYLDTAKWAFFSVSLIDVRRRLYF